jgi:hypothetical protein
MAWNTHPGALTYHTEGCEMDERSLSGPCDDAATPPGRRNSVDVFDHVIAWEPIGLPIPESCELAVRHTILTHARQRLPELENRIRAAEANSFTSHEKADLAELHEERSRLRRIIETVGGDPNEDWPWGYLIPDEAGLRNLIPYETALGHLGEKYPTTPEELAMWVFMGELKAFTRRGEPLNIRKSAPSRPYFERGRIVAEAFFNRAQVEGFDPRAENSTGFWLTYRQLLERWRNQSDDLVGYQQGIIQSRVDEAKREGNGLASSDKCTGTLTPCCPENGIAKTLDRAMFQLRQVEAVEADHPQFRPIARPLAALPQVEPDPDLIWPATTYRDDAGRLFLVSKGVNIVHEGNDCLEIRQLIERHKAGRFTPSHYTQVRAA